MMMWADDDGYWLWLVVVLVDQYALFSVDLGLLCGMTKHRGDGWKGGWPDG